MGLVVGISRTGHNTSHHMMSDERETPTLGYWISTSYMYAHNEGCRLTKSIIYIFQYIYYGLRMILMTNSVTTCPS